MDNQQLTFEDAEATTAAKEAMLSAMLARNEAWMEQAVASFHELKGRLPADFIGEDIRVLLTKEGGVEHRPNSWGPFISFLYRKGHILRTGEHRSMKAEGTNARESRVYRLAAVAVAHEAAE